MIGVVGSDEAIDLASIAAECVTLVAEEFGHRLDWSLDSLAVLDGVCEQLLADGQRSGQRLDLWWRLIGAYTGEVVIRAYDGQWIRHESSPGTPAVQALGVTAFPFRTAHRILSGEPYKSLASLGRALPVIAERSTNS